MNFQDFVDRIEPMTCIISVEKLADGSYGNICLAAGNKAYIDSIENPQHMSSSSMLHNKFIPGSPYEKYIPKDLNFEAACVQCAIQKKPYHTYIHPDRYNFWISMYMMPLASDDPNIGYCSYTQELTYDKSDDRMADISADISSAVLKTTLKLKGAKDFKVNMEQVVSEIRQICKADRCCVFLTDFKERKCSVLAKSVNEEIEVAELEYVINTKYEDFFSIVETWPATIAGSTCIIIKNSRDMEVLKERNPVWCESLVSDGVTSLVLFPLEYNEETLGYIWVANFEVENAMMIKEVLELTTQLIASEIANYQLVDKLKVMSSIDMLTGAYNRNAMNNRVDRMIKSNGKNSETLGVVFADLNGLKQRNDTEGHTAGDKLLKDAAEILKNEFPDGEIYRAGGDEFMIIDRETSCGELEKHVEKLRKDAEDPRNVSFAIGFCFEEGECDIRRAMRTADERMYADKESYYARFPERRRK